MLLSPLPYDEELACLHAPSRKMEYLAVRVLLRCLAGEELHVSHHPSGKPYLVGDSRRISISHTRGYAAVALHPSREVGIDIERRSERVRRASSRFLREDEFPGRDSLSEYDQLTGLLLNWSAKETMFKMMDASGVDFQEHLRVLPFAVQEEGEMTGVEMHSPWHRRYAITYITHQDFVCTYSVE